MPFCSQCGHANPEDSRFCSSCGAALRPPSPGETSTITIGAGGVDPGEQPEKPDSLSTGDQAAVDALPPGSALLIVRRGPNSGSRFLLDSEVTTAGRHPSSDIFLDDVTVSRRHAEFAHVDDGILVRDVGSLNGTYVNRERIDEVVLAGGDEVQIGKYRLVFYPGHQAAGESGGGGSAG
jgi:pSer/pThr/pTyr-binding forkhead associated (FHA) protein